MKFDCGNGSLWLGDCLALMKHIPDGSVDMVLSDLPYGTTRNKWDAIIPFEPLWKEYWRVCKPAAAIVLTASQPFTSALIMSQIDAFKYEWIWRKNSGTGFARANYQPLRYHESVCIFSNEQSIYNKQPTPRLTEASRKRTKTPVTGNSVKSDHGSPYEKVVVQYDSENKNPESVLEFNSVPNNGGGKIHSTQKPVALFEYLIKTYTNSGDLVLDNCSGGGTTAIAAQATGRRWLCIEKELEYYLASAGRIYAAVNA